MSSAGVSLALEQFERTCAELGGAIAQVRLLAAQFDQQRAELARSGNVTAIRQARRRGIGDVAPVNHRLSRAGIVVDRLLHDIAAGLPIELSAKPSVKIGRMEMAARKTG
jgi:hypothetical protein